MNMLLLMPHAHMHTMRLGPLVRSMREMPLSLAMLAALAPPELKISFTVVDGSVDAIPMDATPDLVGISVLTGTAPYAYDLAAHFRRRKIPVILGGPHVTILPDEAAAHADAIVTGTAETMWPHALRDFAAGHLARRYDEPPLAEGAQICLPTPRCDLMRRSGYMMPNVVMAMRGCSHRCDFCTTTALYPHSATRPIADVLRDVQRLPGRVFAFNDVNIVDDRAYAHELFTALIPLRKRWGGLATVTLVDDPELVALMARSGCIYLLFGFESLDQHALRGIHKGFNQHTDYARLMALMHAHRIAVQGCFVLGLDHDDPRVFATTVEQVNALRIDIPRFSLYTPYPGTDLFRRLAQEQRILSYNWADYDTMHVVIQPAQMTPQQLYDGFKWTYRETFRWRHMLRRTAALDWRFPINLIGNLTYRRFTRRLYTEQRFCRPCNPQPAPAAARPPATHTEVVACPA